MWVIAITETPFFPLPAAQRVIAAVGEAMFWIGGVILGTAVVAKFRRPKVTTGRGFAGKRVAVCGRSNRQIAFVNRLSPRAADLLRLRSAGRPLRDAFSSKTPGPPD